MPWWSAFDAYDVDPGWYAKATMAKVLGVSIRELGRVISAITEGWNSFEFLATITLTVDIKVTYGRFKAVLRNDGSGNMAIKAGPREGVAIRNEGRGATKKLPGEPGNSTSRIWSRSTTRVPLPSRWWRCDHAGSSPA